MLEEGPTNPGSVVFQVAAFVLNGVWVSQLSQKLNFFNNVLPLLQKKKKKSLFTQILRYIFYKLIVLHQDKQK